MAVDLPSGNARGKAINDVANQREGGGDYEEGWRVAARSEAHQALIDAMYDVCEPSMWNTAHDVADWIAANPAAVLRALGFPGLATLREANDKLAEKGE